MPAITRNQVTVDYLVRSKTYFEAEEWTTESYSRKEVIDYNYVYNLKYLKHSKYCRNKRYKRYRKMTRQSYIKCPTCSFQKYLDPDSEDLPRNEEIGIFYENYYELSEDSENSDYFTDSP